MLLLVLFYSSNCNCFMAVNKIPNIKYRYAKNTCMIKDDDYKDFYGKINYIDIADIESDDELNYLEFEKLKIKKNKANYKNSILTEASEASEISEGDGFAPLNYSTNMNTLKKYKESEIKHGRLAMLASVGWPMSELYQPYLSDISNSANLLSVNGKVPSVLNGGLDKINPVFFMACIVFATTMEFATLTKKYNEDTVSGDLGFDPLKLYSNKDNVTKRNLELKEINNGRLAMLAITYYTLSEFLTDTPIVKNAPIFFNSFLWV